MLGYSRTESCSSETTPISSTIRLTTDANTGRRTKNSRKPMSGGAHVSNRRSRAAGPGHHLHRRAVAQLLLAGGHPDHAARHTRPNLAEPAPPVGRAACRGRVCAAVAISVWAEHLTRKNHKKNK